MLIRILRPRIRLCIEIKYGIQGDILNRHMGTSYFKAQYKPFLICRLAELNPLEGSTCMSTQGCLIEYHTLAVSKGSILGYKIDINIYTTYART